jgi:hypothetical protein
MRIAQPPIMIAVQTSTQRVKKSSYLRIHNRRPVRPHSRQ